MTAHNYPIFPNAYTYSVNSAYAKRLPDGSIRELEPDFPSWKDDSRIGWVYIIRLERPLPGTRNQYYVGWSADPSARLDSHRRGRGAKFLRKANQCGIAYSIVFATRGTRALERRIHNDGIVRYFTRRGIEV